MTELFYNSSWIVSGLALIGVVLNIRKEKSCFLIWIFTNSYFCIYDASIGAFAQAALFGIYFLLSVWGIYEWKRETA